MFEEGQGVAAVKLDRDLLRWFEKVTQLPKAERDAVLLLIDSVIAKQTLKKVIGSYWKLLEAKQSSFRKSTMD